MTNYFLKSTIMICMVIILYLPESRAADRQFKEVVCRPGSRKARPYGRFIYLSFSIPHPANSHKNNQLVILHSFWHAN
jgi:hypothetical protein